MRRRVLLLTVLMFNLPVWAEWKLIAANADSPALAQIESENGAQLAIYKNAGAEVIMRLVTAAAANLATCPTYEFNDRPPATRTDAASCQLTQAQSELVLGSISDNAITSTVLNRLLNANTITFRYALAAPAGYAQAAFSLSSSKQVIMEVIGNGVTVNAK